MHYDPQVIVQFAANLYARAADIIRSYTVLGAFVGLLVAGAIGVLVGGATAGSPGTGALILGLVGAVLGGYGGYQAGQEKAFSLKLQAQMALCQVQIEANTSSGASRQKAA